MNRQDVSMIFLILAVAPLIEKIKMGFLFSINPQPKKENNQGKVETMACMGVVST